MRLFIERNCVVQARTLFLLTSDRHTHDLTTAQTENGGVEPLQLIAFGSGGRS
jgi:hypothetical protein